MVNKSPPYNNHAWSRYFFECLCSYESLKKSFRLLSSTSQKFGIFEAKPLTIIVSESRRGGRGWRLYDTAFRQPFIKTMRSFETMDFAKINQSLYSTTILAFSGGRQKFCTACMLSDHTQEECGLHPNLGRPMAQARDGGAASLRGQERRKRERIGACYAWNESRCTFV